MTGPYDRYTTMLALKRAVPYIRIYRDKIFVVKVGGTLCDDPGALKDVVEQLGILRELGIKLILVHGGGSQTTDLQSKLGVETKFVNGRRVTDERTLQIAVMTINGSVSTTILASCRALGISAVGISGVDAGLVRARRRPVQQVDVDGTMTSVDYGLVGDVAWIDPRILYKLLDAGVMPVISPLSCDDQGQVLNINADTVAARIATEMAAEKLVFLTSEVGVLEDRSNPSTLVSYTDVQGLDKLKERGCLAKGMLPKTNAAKEALLGGVKRVHIVGYVRPTSLLVEIFTNEGAGTLIVKDTAELLPSEQTSASNGPPSSGELRS